MGSSGRGDRLSYALKGSDRACMEAGANLFLRASAIARHYDPTLTRTLPRSGDRS
ncbi:hypothetical protein J0895_23180 [Phormidium pseudopriestleyi FRX01]|uniref:Uncharacterized protein n=1 Tax=Phormidium pseudopriestleyi FRX01 TaxID=1759528 RepID=A0ABS3FYL3_9CYAN|nr:hypothetical protein [Phormidium pseudopriestleyi]MBO0351932.1 hypothetical protein [Phormidium pseudopriestleyi FRX01]